MLTRKEQNIIVANTLEYAFAKMSKDEFLCLSEIDKLRQRKRLAQLRITQIERNPGLYPDGVTGNLASVAG